jgi:hypothetical protein
MYLTEKVILSILFGVFVYIFSSRSFFNNKEK